MNVYAPWASSFENLETCVRKDQLKGSDAAGVFWTTVNRFLRLLFKEEKDDDPSVAELRKQFEEYVRFEGTQLKDAKLRILDLCLKICAKFQGGS